MSRAGLRKAALALVTMHPADQRWILSRLSRPSRVLVSSSMRGARRFSNIDPDILQAALDGKDAPMAEVPAPGVLIAVLDSLSVQWAARALAAAASDHAEIYLASCQKLRADAIRHEMSRLDQPFPLGLAGAMARCLSDAGQVLVATEALR